MGGSQEKKEISGSGAVPLRATLEIGGAKFTVDYLQPPGVGAKPAIEKVVLIDGRRLEHIPPGIIRKEQEERESALENLREGVQRAIATWSQNAFCDPNSSDAPVVVEDAFFDKTRGLRGRYKRVWDAFGGNPPEITLGKELISALRSKLVIPEEQLTLGIGIVARELNNFRNDFRKEKVEPYAPQKSS